MKRIFLSMLSAFVIFSCIGCLRTSVRVAEEIIDHVDEHDGSCPRGLPDIPNDIHSIVVEDAIAVYMWDDYDSASYYSNDKAGQLRYEVGNGTLHLWTDRANDKAGKRTTTERIYVQLPEMPNLDKIKLEDVSLLSCTQRLHGNVNITIEDVSCFRGSVDCDNLSLKINDVSQFTGTINAKQASICVEDVSMLDADGNIDRLTLTVADVSKVASAAEGNGLTAKNLTAVVRDNSNVEISCTDTLSVTCTDMSSFTYRGDPVVTKREKHSFGKIRKE